MPPRPATPTDRRWQARAEELQFGSLAAIQDAAQKWSGTLGALTGIFGTVALVKGPQDLTGLGMLPLVNVPGSLAVVAVLGLALLLLFAAIYEAAIAAQGVPQRIALNGTTLRREYPAAAAAAAIRLHRSHLLVIPATLAIAVGVGITWLGPRDPAPARSLLVVTRSGQVLCEPMRVDAAGRVTVETNGTETPLSEVASATTVDRCR